MTSLFLSLLKMSMTSTYLILAVILLRALLKRVPKWISCLMWALVGIRLVLPFSFESVFSLIPQGAVNPAFISSGVSGVSESVHTQRVVNSVILDSQTNTVGNTVQDLLWIAAIVWVIGIICMLSYFVISYVHMLSRVKTAAHLSDNVWACDNIPSAFILGIIKPRIYIPSYSSAMQRSYMISHENMHIKRHDHLWKPLGFLLLSVYWFNPICWVAYCLLCRDIEFACDEKVIKNYSCQSKKEYSNTLLSCSVSRKMITACPLAFGEVDVKGRIKNVLSYKRPTLWIICVALIACLVTSVLFMTNPKDISNEKLTSPDSITISFEADAEIEEEVISLAKKTVYDEAMQINNSDKFDYSVISAEISNLTRMPCACVGEDSGVMVYLLEYRLTPDNLKKIDASNGCKLENGKITETTDEGQPHLFLNYQITNGSKLFSLLSVMRTKTIEEIYQNSELSDGIQDMYTAAAVSLRNDDYNTYIYHRTSINKPSLKLSLKESDKTFILTYTERSSGVEGIVTVSVHTLSGRYNLTDSSLICKADDTDKTFVFKVENNKLIFDAEKSSNFNSKPESNSDSESLLIPDRAEFIKNP